MALETKQALVMLGSNIDPESNIACAIRALEHHDRITVRARSNTFESAPVGATTKQPDFQNAAVRIETDLPPSDLKEELRAIEDRLGRVRSEDKFAPRTIDLDIAFYADEELELAGGRIPDPDVAKYGHLAIPLAEVAPDWVDPTTGLTLQELAHRLDDQDVRLHPMSYEAVPFETGGRYAVELEARPGEVYSPRFEALVEQMLIELGEDPERRGLDRTPLRVAKAMDFLTSGYTKKLDEVVNDALFEAPFEEMVLVKEIEFYSLCEHHMLPFFGKAAVGYVPDGKVLGVSKVARIVDLFARRLQIQERLTNQIADALMEVLEPLGVAVVIEASHFCMMMRGVQKQGSSMVTSAMRGSYRDNPRTRSEFLDLAKD